MNPRNSMHSYHEGDIISLTLRIGTRIRGTYFCCDGFVGIDFSCPQRLRPEQDTVAATYMPADFRENVYAENGTLIIAR